MWFKKKKKSQIILVMAAIVLIWRGLWGIADTYIFPDNPAISFVASIALGLILLYFVDPDFSDLQ